MDLKTRWVIIGAGISCEERRRKAVAAQLHRYSAVRGALFQ